MCRTFNTHAQAAACIRTKNKVSLAASDHGILAGTRAIGRINAFNLSGHIKRIFRRQADVMIGTIFRKDRPDRANRVACDTPGQA